MVQYVKSIAPANGDLAFYVQNELSRIEMAMRTGGSTSSSGGGSGGTSIGPPAMRLSLTSGTAVTTADVTGATTIYGVPVGYGSASLYDGSSWVVYTFTTDRTLVLDTTGHLAGTGYTVFLYYDGTALKLGTGPAWTTATAPGTGAGTSETEIFEGTEVNKYDITLRNNSSTTIIGARRAIAMGAFGTTSAGLTDDTQLKRLLSNIYYAEDRFVFKSDSTDSWSGSASGVWRQARGDTANQIEVFFYSGAHLANIRASGLVSNSTSTIRTAGTAIGLDSTSIPASNSFKDTIAVDNTRGWPLKAEYAGYPGRGRHKLVWLELSGTVDTRTWYGDNGDVTTIQTGLCGSVVN